MLSSSWRLTNAFFYTIIRISKSNHAHPTVLHNISATAASLYCFKMDEVAGLTSNTSSNASSIEKWFEHNTKIIQIITKKKTDFAATKLLRSLRSSAYVLTRQLHMNKTEVYPSIETYPLNSKKELPSDIWCGIECSTPLSWQSFQWSLHVDDHQLLKEPLEDLVRPHLQFTIRPKRN